MGLSIKVEKRVPEMDRLLASVDGFSLYSYSDVNGEHGCLFVDGIPIFSFKIEMAERMADLFEMVRDEIGEKQ